MKNRIVIAGLGAAFASAIVVACVSSTPISPGGTEDSGLCNFGDGSVTTTIAQIDAGLCGACVQSQCSTVLTACAADCTCNGTALQALACIETLGAAPSTVGVTTCLTPLGNSSDGTTDQLSSCLQGCAGACGMDAGKDASTPADAGNEAASAIDAGTDATLGDSGSDGAPADAAGDAMQDGGFDAGEGAGTDASDDAPLDSPTDSPACTTTISGKVLDPGGHNPLYGVNVYVPSTAPITLPRGIATDAGGSACSCASLLTPSLAGTTTAIDGTFSLQVPSGSVPIIVQVGKWRTSQSHTITPCMDNPLGSLTLPQSSSQGDMPDIAVSTGSADALECLLSRMGISALEWVPGNVLSGHVHVFAGGNPGADAGLDGLPEKNPISGTPASATSLWDSANDLLPYDVIMLSCEGGETFGANPTALESYVNLGGRVLASHYHYAWFSGALVSGQGYGAPADWGTNLAIWTGGAGLGDGGASTANAIPQTKLLSDGGPFFEGVENQAWLNVTGALTSNELPVQTPRYNATLASANTSSQPWLIADNASGDPGAAMLFSFDTPIDAPAPGDGGSPTYCGRVVYTDLHDDQADTTNSVGGKAPPAGCSPAAMTAQEKELEFVFFNLNGCVGGP